MPQERGDTASLRSYEAFGLKRSGRCGGLWMRGLRSQGDWEHFDAEARPPAPGGPCRCPHPGHREPCLFSLRLLLLFLL